MRDSKPVTRRSWTKAPSLLVAAAATLLFFAVPVATAQSISEAEFNTMQEAMALGSEKKFDEAIALVDTLIDNPSTGDYVRANALNTKGYFQYQKNDYVAALESYKSVLRIDGIDNEMRVQTTYTAAQLTMLVEEHKDALRYIDDYLRIAPSVKPTDHLLRAQVLFRLNRFSQMEDPLLAAIRMAERNGGTDKEDWWKLLALTYLETKDVEKLDGVYATLNERWPSEQTASQAVGAYIKIPDRERTTRALQYLLLNYPTTDYMGPLHLAVAKGDAQAARDAVAAGADIDSEMGSFRPPLHLAAGFGDTAMIDVLLELGADINYVSNQGSRVTHASSMAGDADLTRYLWERGAYLGVDEDSKSITFVNLASTDDVDFVSELIAAYPDLLEKQGNSALSLAVGENNAPMASMLLEAGAPTEGEAQVVPLRQASTRGYMDLATQLLDAGADVNFADENGFTALLSAVRARQSRMAVMLIERGADVSGAFPNGNCVLSEAAYVDDTAVFDAALAAGAPAQGVTGDGRPLRYSMYASNYDAMQTLIDNGADLAYSDDENRPILILAVAQQNAGAAELLLRNGANIVEPLETLTGWKSRDVTRFLKKQDFRRSQRGDPEIWASDDGTRSVSIPDQKEAFSLPQIVSFMEQSEIGAVNWIQAGRNR